MKKLLQAACFAAQKHTLQRRKGTGDKPYINHPLEVACLLASVGGVTDEDILSAAILHDTLEDTATTPEELSSAFGEAVVAYVSEVSDDKSLSKAERKRLQTEHSRFLSVGARLIKLGDKIDNLRSVVSEPPRFWPVERQIGYFEWALAVFQGLKNTDRALEALFMHEYTEGLEKLMNRKDSPMDSTAGQQ